MTIKAQLEQALATLPLFSSGEQAIDVTDGPQHLSCQLVALDSLACAWRVSRSAPSACKVCRPTS